MYWEADVGKNGKCVDGCGEQVMWKCGNTTGTTAGHGGNGRL